MKNQTIRNTSNILIKTLRMILHYKKYIFLILIILNNVISLLPYISILLSQKLINLIQLKQSSISTLVQIGIIYVMTKILNTLLVNINSFTNQYYSEYLFLMLNKLFLNKCNKLNYSDYENAKTYDMLQRAEQNIGIKTLALINDVLLLFSNIISFIVSLIILSNWHDWVLIGFIILPFISYKYFISINNYEQKIVMERTDSERKSWYLTFLMIKDYYIKEVRTFGLTNYLMKQYCVLKEIIFNQNISIYKRKTIFTFMYKLANTLFSSLIVMKALLETYMGKILVGNFMTYINTTSMIESNITSTVSTVLSIYTDCLYCNYILEFFDICDSQDDNYINKIKVDKIESIEFKNVSFKYPKSNAFAIENFSYYFKSNKVYAIVGHNGSGKSTLIKLIAGLYSNYTGEILINGINLKQIDEDNLKEKMRVIFQDFNRYEFTVKENINIGNIKNNDIGNIVTSAKITGADDFIIKLPFKYEQQLGNWFEGGIQLSGGQWQKIAVSRALVKKEGCYILDEPTAALDPLSEYNFFKKLKDNINNSIGILVTHRFTNAKMSDEILVISNGRLVEFGTHDELINYKKEYYKLYMLQRGESN